MLLALGFNLLSIIIHVSKKKNREITPEKDRRLNLLNMLNSQNHVSRLDYIYIPLYPRKKDST